ncbi:Ribosomal RNA large subunit methyltransferase E [bacterium HR34]|nr:Ribosomal RNA large subunit methyltransferase E [bacterium HR34]
MHPIYSKKDTFSKKAKEKNYPARSVFKLQEINKKFKIIKPGTTVLDLGASPGSWTMYCAEELKGKGKIVAVDIKDIKNDILKIKNIEFYKMSIFDDKIFNLGEFDVLLSDAAPNTTGIREVDHARQIELVKRVIEIAKTNLKRGGNVVCKVFEGAEMRNIINEFKKLFKKALLYKPEASRKESREIYLIGLKKI